METYPEMPKAEWNLWRLDQMINLRGMPVDTTYVAHAATLMRASDATTLATLKDLTGCQNPNSDTQMKGWLGDQDYPMESIAAERVDVALLDDLPPQVRDALLLRQKLSGAGPKKLAAITNQLSPDGLLRNQFNFYGGHTGRWSGRGVQVQNLPRPDFTIAGRVGRHLVQARLTALSHRPRSLERQTNPLSWLRS
jgi:DNA polymerase